jgi:hypothetical protein
MIIVRAFLPLLVFYFVGVLVLWVTFGRRPRLISTLGLGMGCGSGVLGLGMFYLAYWRMPLDLRTLEGMTLIICFGLIVCLFARRKKSSESFPARKCDEPWNGLHTGLCVLLGGTLLLVFSDALSQPLLGFDSRAIWGMKAKIIFHQQSIYTEDFFDSERLHAKNRYPLLIPLLENFVYHFSGSQNDRTAKVIFPFFYLSLLALFYETVRLGLNRLASLWGLILFALLPAFLLYNNGGAASGYVDLPLTYFTSVTAVHLYRWMLTGSRGNLVIAGFSGVFAAFTKNEGIPLTAITFMVFMGASAWMGKQLLLGRLRDLLITLLGASVLLLPWLHFRSQLPITDEDFERLVRTPNLISGLNRVPQILGRLVQEYYLKPHIWNVMGLCLLLPLTELLRGRKKTLEDVFIFIPLFYTLLVVAIFMVTPWQLNDLMPVALTRLTMHTVPLAFLWLLLTFPWIRFLGSEAEVSDR